LDPLDAEEELLIAFIEGLGGEIVDLQRVEINI
jgi:hypothetical protein